MYIEGGASTASSFLNDGSIDVVQLHFSPMILGSGVNTFSCPAVDRISDSIRFGFHTFVPVGDGMMFVVGVHREQ